MRTTLAIDDDVLAEARALADQQRRTIGEIVSDLARQSLGRPIPPQTRNGLRLLPAIGTGRVTIAHVNRLRDEGP